MLALAAMLASAAPAADAALIEAAKKEGQVVWYTTLIVNQAIRPRAGCCPTPFTVMRR